MQLSANAIALMQPIGQTCAGCTQGGRQKLHYKDLGQSISPWSAPLGPILHHTRQ
jgi:hypothetical protein